MLLMMLLPLVLKRNNANTQTAFLPLLLTILLGLPGHQTLPDTLKIGGLFGTHDDELEIAFRYAIKRMNADRTILPGSTLVAHVERIPPHDSFLAAKKACGMVESGVVAIFGPSLSAATSVVQSTCEALQLPHLSSSWNLGDRPSNVTVNLAPHPAAVGQAFLDFVKERKWKSFTVIYEENEDLIKMQHLLQMSHQENVRISLHQTNHRQDFKKLLKDVRKDGETNIVLDLPVRKIRQVLREAQSVGMMTEYHNYMITSLDLHTVDLGDFQNGRTNISGFLLMDPERDYVKPILSRWIEEVEEESLGQQKRKPMKIEAALLYDAVVLFCRAFHELNHKKPIRIQTLNCALPSPWSQGKEIVDHLKSMNSEGLTGGIRFDEKGFRSDFELDIVEVKKRGLSKVGTWDIATGINLTSNYSAFFHEVIQSLKNRTLRVTTILNAPYMMLKKPSDKLTGNERFEGFCVDLLAHVSKILGFKYEIRVVRDRSYGSRNEKGEWNGMIKELIDREADLAIADLTITYEREEAVDFTMPFMNLGISILFKKPSKKVPKLFSFLAPLSLEVWLYMATSYLGVSLLLFLLARFSPYEWVSPHPCDPSPDHLENHYSLANSLWFTIGSLMQQGCDVTPRALSTRVLAGIWWFFTLIMISSYTANLAAFLTVQRMTSPIESAEDLSKQNTIQYGCVVSGSTKAFFKDSKIEIYKRMWSVMESARPSVFTESNAKGVERVLKGNYAFLMESTTIEYIIERKCELTQIGGLLDSKGYGIATPSGSPYRTPLSSAILKLQEEGMLHVLKERWWKMKGGGKCAVEEKVLPGSANSLGMANVGGVFVVLLGGLGIACIICVVELIWKTKKEPEDQKMEGPASASELS